MLSQGDESISKVDLYSTNKEEERSQGKNHAHSDGPQSRVICYVENNDSRDKILEPLYNALDHVKLRFHMLLKDFEQDYTDDDLKNPISCLKCSHQQVLRIVLAQIFKKNY